MKKHWSRYQLLSDAVANENIILKGTHSYYSDCWDVGFEESVVRYLIGDEVTRNWDPRWELDKLYIGDYVCIGAETVILMGGNHTHRADWFSLYPFPEVIDKAYVGKGDTCLQDGCWLGMRSMIMPGVTIGEGAIVATNSVVTKDVEPYSIVAGNPARFVKYRFPDDVREELLKLRIYEWPETKFHALRPYICDSNIEALKQHSIAYDQHMNDPNAKP